MALPVVEASAFLDSIGASKVHFDTLKCFTAQHPESRAVEFVRAPGRVNIIGEHTDYNGLPVLPMAIDREVVIAFEARAKPKIELVNVDPAYPRTEFALSGEIPPFETGHWGNYAKAGAQAVWEWAAEHSPGSLPLVGFAGCLGGSIPPSAGLSSSSAVVVSAACALVSVNRLCIGKAELADLLARGERYVGTQGGGMDHAVLLLAEEGSALKIDFFPLRTKPVRLPEGHVIVVANSMVSATKTGDARIAFNTRVAECRLGLEMLRARARNRDPDVESVSLLRDFAEAVPEWELLLGGLPSQSMSLSEIGDYARVPAENLAATCLTQRDGTLLPQPGGGFQPKKRCRHVLTEGARVEQAAAAMERGDALELGRLMDASHESCAHDYEISCPDLDRLVEVMRRSGALGARLTGAGFGGCAVALVREDGVARFLDAVWRDYFEGSSALREDFLFACRPACGAAVIG